MRGSSFGIALRKDISFLTKEVPKLCRTKNFVSMQRVEQIYRTSWICVKDRNIIEICENADGIDIL